MHTETTKDPFNTMLLLLKTVNPRPKHSNEKVAPDNPSAVVVETRSMHIEDTMSEFQKALAASKQ
jgi:hypothetical protein